jgi:hypothetical protein
MGMAIRSCPVECYSIYHHKAATGGRANGLVAIKPRPVVARMDYHKAATGGRANGSDFARPTVAALW